MFEYAHFYLRNSTMWTLPLQEVKEAIYLVLFSYPLLSATIILFLYLSCFVQKYVKYPNGPVPIPILGNLLFIRRHCPLYKWITKAHQEGQYPDMMTLWFGMNNPVVIISSVPLLRLVHTGPLKAIYAGRPPLTIGKAFNPSDAPDISFGDYGPAWNTIRKVGHVALRKYAKSEHLSDLCRDITDRFVAEYIQRDNADGFAEIIIQNIVGSAVFGQTFNSDDEFTREINAGFKKINSDTPDMFPSDIWPPLGWIYRKQERSVGEFVALFVRIVKHFYQKAKKDYSYGVIRHFTDNLLAARDEGISEQRSSAKYLDEASIQNALLDMFEAGIGTSKSQLGWMLLRLANDPPLQALLRRRILDVLDGDKNATKDDMNRLPEVVSFMHEIFRYYPPVPLAMPHRTTEDSELGGHFIPKHTTIFFNIYAASFDPNEWDQPNDFRWDRFLDKDTNTFINVKQHPAFLTFGIGPRQCIGEQMAKAELFYVLTRILKKCSLSLPNGPGSADLNPGESSIFIDLRPQTILIKKLTKLCNIN